MARLSAYQTAIATLRRCQEGMARDPSAEERRTLLQLHEEALQLLEQCGRQRMRTAALTDRVAVLEDQLRSLSPGERARIICERLGLSRSRYYQLKGSDSAQST